MAITLDQVLSAPPDQDALYQHMLKIGAVMPPPEPPKPTNVPEIQPAAAGPKIPEMEPAQPSWAPYDMKEPNAPAHQPKPEAPNIGNVPNDVSATAPMGPEDHVLPHLDFRGRQNLPTTSPGVGDLTSGFYRNEFQRLRDQNANHWGTPESTHPGALGKIGHVLAKVGNIAGDVVAPGTMALIPGTELNRRGQGAELQREAAGAQQRETQEEAVHQRPEIAEETGAMRERVEEARERGALEKEKERDAALAQIGAGHDTARVGSAQIGADSRETVGAAANTSKEKIAGLGKSDFDKYYHEQLAEGMPDTATNRLRAHQAWDAASKDPNGGAFIPFYDPDGKVIGAWNPRIKDPKQAVSKIPNELAAAGTTSQGAGIQNKNETRFDKQKKDYENIIDRASKADMAAQDPTGPGDYQILMSFVEATKPSSGFRFTESERKMITEATSLAGKVNADYDHYIQGTFFAPEQRQQMLDIIHNAATQASGHLKDINEGRIHSSPGQEHISGAPAGKTAVYDEKGNRHWANSNTLKQMLADEKYKGWSTSKPNGAANQQ